MPSKPNSVVNMGGAGAVMFKDCTVLQQRWLAEYCDSGDAEKASTRSNTEHLTAMTWMRDDDVFKTAFDQGRMVVALGLEAAAKTKALSEEGSDRLIIELLRSMWPDKYDPANKQADMKDDYDGSFSQLIDVGEPEADAV